MKCEFGLFQMQALTPNGLYIKKGGRRAVITKPLEFAVVKFIYELAAFLKQLVIDGQKY